MKNNLSQLALDGLKKRLDANNQLLVQKWEGLVYPTKFTFNSPATLEMIEEFLRDTQWHLPADYKKFLLIHNGAWLFAGVRYGGGYELLSLDEIKNSHLDYMPKHWYPVSINNGDYIFIDSNRVKAGQNNYLVCFNHDDVSTSEGFYLNMTFETWLERLIIAQGTEFWTW
ncbi:SMI1/KNR4 family protein [Brevibacillus sp. MS2.2]|uniref:SMI1/KNR4 family protein n=1 Tax=Brevibacillus sp. MS2.2 TaxID=2738981 RepID=UPI00156A7AD8|nr:SMI1/KNR4 family protein [Brevibacillus sp. MS2.2]NRR19735.1 SMI1/KNR4 family protein [Brevibacillus sp. MS2.2]